MCLPTPPLALSLRVHTQVPYRLLKAFHKIQQRLVRELEKKFSGKDVVFIGTRRIMPPPKSGKSIARPRSRTLTAVSGGEGEVWGSGGWMQHTHAWPKRVFTHSQGSNSI